MADNLQKALGLAMGKVERICRCGHEIGDHYASAIERAFRCYHCRCSAFRRAPLLVSLDRSAGEEGGA